MTPPRRAWLAPLLLAALLPAQAAQQRAPVEGAAKAGPLAAPAGIALPAPALDAPLGAAPGPALGGPSALATTPLERSVVGSAVGARVDGTPATAAPPETGRTALPLVDAFRAEPAIVSRLLLPAVLPAAAPGALAPAAAASPESGRDRAEARAPASSGLPTPAAVAARARALAAAQGLDDEKRDAVELPREDASPALGLGFAAGRDGTARGDSAGAEPPAPPAPPASDEGWARRASRAFFVSLLVAQLGVETVGLAVPQIANKLAGDFQTSAILPAVSFSTLALGALLAGPMIDRFGIRRVYRTLFAARLAVAAVLAAAGMTTLPVLIVLFGLDYMILGALRTSEAVVPVALHGASRGKVAGFGTFQSMVIEGMGIFGLTVAGYLISMSFGIAMTAYPLAIAAAAALVFWRLKLPDQGTGETVTLWQRFSATFSALKTNSLMRLSVLAISLICIMSAWVYFNIGPNFGLFAGGSGLSVSAVTLLTPLLYAAGGFSSTVLMTWLDKRAAPALAALPEAERPAAERRKLLRSAAAWLAFHAAVLLFGASFLIPGPWAAFAFMFPFGLASTAAFVNLEALIKTEAPKEVRGSVMGIVRFMAYLVGGLSFPFLGWVFHLFSTVSPAGVVPTAGAFVVLSVLLAAIGAAFAWVARALRRSAI